MFGRRRKNDTLATMTSVRSPLLMIHALVSYALSDGGEAFTVWLDGETPAGIPTVATPVVKRRLDVMHANVDQAILIHHPGVLKHAEDEIFHDGAG